METKKENSSLISVIVPVFRVEKYLPECIESILKQSYPNLEIVLVDDGSPDRSGAICDEFARKDSRIKVIHQQNGGVTSARAAGFGISSGDLVCFVDSDDVLPENAVERLYRAMTPEVDIVVGEYDEYDSFRNAVKTVFYPFTTMDREIYLRQMVKNLLPPSIWAKLYRRNLFTSESFAIPRSIIIGEDWLMNIQLAFSLERDVRFIRDIVYHYRYNPESVTQVRKSNFDYEEFFYCVYMSFIPDYFLKSQHFKDTIYARLRMFYNVTGNTSRFPQKRYSIITQLRADVKSYHYRLPLCYRILLYNENTVVRSLFIVLRKAFRVLGINSFLDYDDTAAYEKR